MSRSLWERQKTNKRWCAAIRRKATRHQHLSVNKLSRAAASNRGWWTYQGGFYIYIINDLYLSLYTLISYNIKPTHRWSEYYWSSCLWMEFVLSHLTDVTSFSCLAGNYIVFVFTSSCLLVHKYFNMAAGGFVKLYWPLSALHNKRNMNFCSIYPIKNTNVILMEELGFVLWREH